jgi:hypothetical protein
VNTHVLSRPPHLLTILVGSNLWLEKKLKISINFSDFVLHKRYTKKFVMQKTPKIAHKHFRFVATVATKFSKNRIFDG